MDSHSLGNYLKRMQKCEGKSLLEAKIGGYKIYDKDLLSLIGENGWVVDNVSMGCV